MSMSLKLIAIIIGILLIFCVFRAMVQKRLSETQSCLWLVAAACLIILGICPQLVSIMADALGIWWAPSILLFCVSVILSFVAFSHAKEISLLRSQLAELSMQVALLKMDEKKIKQECEDGYGISKNLKKENGDACIDLQ